MIAAFWDIIFISWTRYSTFVRVGTGLSFADYVWLRQKPWKVWDPNNPPDFLLTAKRTHEDKGDMYLEPEEYVPDALLVELAHRRIPSSFMLRIKAAEITTSGMRWYFWNLSRPLAGMWNRSISFGRYNEVSSSFGNPWWLVDRWLYDRIRCVFGIGLVTNIDYL